jgi:prepilin-type N-terminal cleavage/methylation domain-containing protein
MLIQAPRKHQRSAAFEKGFSLIELLIVVAIILIIAAIAIPNLLRSRIASNESSAVGSVRFLNTAQAEYASAHPASGFACDLGALEKAGLIDSVLAKGSKSGYVFALASCKKDKRGITVGYTWVAGPVSPQTGLKFYCSDQTGVIRSSTKDATDCIQNGTPLG